MKYEAPICELLRIDMADVICTSVEDVYDSYNENDGGVGDTTHQVVDLT